MRTKNGGQRQQSSRTQAIANFTKEEKLLAQNRQHGAMKRDYRMKGRKRKVAVSSGITHFQPHCMSL